MMHRRIVHTPEGVARLLKQMLDDLEGGGKCLAVFYEVAKPASKGQKALLNIWVNTIAAHRLNKPKKAVTKEEKTKFKRAIKKRFYLDTHEPFVITEESTPFNPDGKEVEFSSTADWTQLETFRFMEWLQHYCATEFDLILESTGDHQAMRQEFNR